MFSKKTEILLIEDMTSIRIWEKKLLLQMGFVNICEAQNGIDALEILNDQHENQKPIQLILCDWRMPEMDGLVLLKELKTSIHFQNIPFVMISAESDSSKVLQAMESGADHYIIKPFTAEKLEENLKVIWKEIQSKLK